MKPRQFTIGLLLLTLPLLASAVSDNQASGEARIHSIDQSEIQGRALFLDTGSADTGLVVSATATGLDPNQGYISLVYDIGAVSGGPSACVPSPASTLGFQKMFVGTWVVNPDGTGRLFAVKTGSSYAPLADLGAVSIRVIAPAGPAVLQGCGQVRTNP